MRINCLILTFVLVLACSVAGVATGKENTCCGSHMTTVRPLYQVVTSKELKVMLENRAEDLILIDARTFKEYQKAHIRNAVSIPVEQLEKKPTMLDVPKDAKLVFYCNGVKCGKSGKSANIAIEQGYKDVSVYADGMPVWKEKGYPLGTGSD